MELLFAEEPPAPPPSQAMKMVLVVREDLGMTRGKVAAQCAHAALGGARRADASVIERWAGAGETMIVVAAPHEGLSALRDAASTAGLPHCKHAPSPTPGEDRGYTLRAGHASPRSWPWGRAGLSEHFRRAWMRSRGGCGCCGTSPCCVAYDQAMIIHDHRTTTRCRPLKSIT